MSINKSWTSLENRNSPEFEKGLNDFVERSKAHVDSNGLIRCPCRACVNNSLKTLLQMKGHIHRFGFERRYVTWVYHGESRTPPVVDRIAPNRQMADVLDDVMEELRENNTNHAEGEPNAEGSNVDQGFSTLLEEVQSKLFRGCTWTTALDFMTKLMSLKASSRWSNSSFNLLLDLLKFSLPKQNKVPSSSYVAKSKLKKLGLGYELIHVCKNDCALFWKENKGLQNCHVCNESRWVEKKKRGKKVAHKVLRYFPLIPRLRRLYGSRHTAKDMIWHSTGRSEEGTMRHPVDGTSWKNLDSKYPDFSSEPRNVHLRLAADGFNPFGNMSTSHSTWPVIINCYNLPPWLCMKESYFMLSLLIPDPKSPGTDMDVFLKPLVEDLKRLWHEGVRTRDAATNTLFTMKASLLWTINDFPARSSLSGWSGQGYKACPTCNEDTSLCRVLRKTSYVGHRRFLDPNDPRRKSLEFDGKHETRPAPRQFSEEQIQAQLARLLPRISGKHPNFGGVKQTRAEFELNWSKRSIFFELEYWSSLQLKHNLDVMHIEKNVCDSVLGTLMMNDKSKDTPNARQDLEMWNIRKPLASYAT